MENKRSNAAASRLCSLHDSIIQHILSFLPTKEAVKTCILAKKYLKIWASVPALNFVLTSPTDVNFINQVIAHRRSSYIRSFFVISDQDLGNDGISSWVDYAVAHNVQEIEINLNWTTDLKIIENLYFCQSLESLTLRAVVEQPLQVSLPRTQCFVNLRILNVMLCDAIPGNLIGELVSHCCKLESLSLAAVYCEVLNISAPNLKRMQLTFLSCGEVRVSCPSLQILLLRIEEKLDSFCGDIPSLQWAYIGRPSINSGSSLFWRNILKSVNCANHLSLSYADYKFFSGNLLAGSDMHLPTFHNLKILQLGACLHHWNIEFIVHLLKETPNLEYLIIKVEPACSCNDETKQWRTRKLPSKVLHNLKVVKIANDTKFNIASMCEFVKFLSINVCVWEEVIKVI